MNFKEALSKLEKSSAFKDFKKKNPSAYLCAGFFIKDYESGSDVSQIDFQSDKDIATFIIDRDVSVKTEKPMKPEKIPELKANIKVDLDDVEKLIKKEAEKLKISQNVKKIIAILQMHENRVIWNITNILETFIVLTMQIDAIDGGILKSEKSSLFDFFKKPADYVG